MFTDEGNYAAIIDLLLTAINNKRKVVLQNYTPGSSQTPQIRHIEPIAITELKYLTAFDTKAKKNKVYSIFRIGKVTILDEAQEFENDHKHVKPDIFGMTTGKAYPLKLKLSPRACLLMKEEFPRSVEFLRKTGDSKHPYIFDGYVYALEGVGRFVMGLLHETVIEQPIELKEYIAEKISDYNSSDKF
jgi:predicted DNA-binding transcriptional regulator YafY